MLNIDEAMEAMNDPEKVEKFKELFSVIQLITQPDMLKVGMCDGW